MQRARVEMPFSTTGDDRATGITGLHVSSGVWDRRPNGEPVSKAKTSAYVTIACQGSDGITNRYGICKPGHTHFVKCHNNQLQPMADSRYVRLYSLVHP